jgi:hypothetical protein
MTLGAFKYEDAVEIKQRVLGSTSNMFPEDTPLSLPDMYYVELIEDLPASTGNSEFTQAEAVVLRYELNSADGQSINAETLDMVVTDTSVDFNKITVTNRTGSALSSGDLIFVIKWRSEYVPVSLSSGSGGGEGNCPCECLEEGTITLDGDDTVSQWRVQMPTVRQDETNGDVIFPAGTYTLTWNATEEYWEKDIGDDLTAEYNDGSDATSASTLSGSLIFRKNDSSYTTLKLTITATIPAP